MPKRQPKPEPITPEEVMDSPALQGFDTFLRYRSQEGGQANRGAGEPAGSGSVWQGESDTGDIPICDIPASVLPTGLSPPGLSPIGDIARGIAEFKPGPKIRRALKAQDGHSMGEQAVYEALWKNASAETTETRLIRIGYGGLQSLCGLDKTNCKDNIQSLIRKLAVEIAEPFSVKKNQGNAYRIFSASAILRRRKEAGMEWVIRNRGVVFVGEPPVGD